MLARACCMVGALITLRRAAIRNWLEKTENCRMKCRSSASVGLARLEPAGVLVVGDDAVVEKLVVHLGQEIAEVINVMLGQFAMQQPFIDARRQGQTAGSRGQ